MARYHFVINFKKYVAPRYKASLFSSNTYHSPIEMIPYSITMKMTVDSSIKNDENNLFDMTLGVTGTTSMCTYYFAMQYLPLSEAVTIAFLNPLIIVPWAYFLFHDKVGLRSVVGICIAIVGVTVIERPAFIFGK